MAAAIIAACTALIIGAFFIGRSVGSAEGVVDGLDEAIRELESTKYRSEVKTEMTTTENSYIAKHAEKSEQPEIVYTAEVPNDEWLRERVKILEKENRKLAGEKAALEKKLSTLTEAARVKVETQNKRISELEKAMVDSALRQNQTKTA